MAKTDPYVQEAVATVYELTQEERIRQQCEAREDYRRRTVGRERMLKEALEAKARLQDKMEQLLEEKEQWGVEKEQLSEEIERLKSLLSQKGIDDESLTKK